MLVHLDASHLNERKIIDQWIKITTAKMNLKLKEMLQKYLREQERKAVKVDRGGIEIRHNFQGLLQTKVCVQLPSRDHAINIKWFFFDISVSLWQILVGFVSRKKKCIYRKTREYSRSVCAHQKLIQNQLFCVLDCVLDRHQRDRRLPLIQSFCRAFEAILLAVVDTQTYNSTGLQLPSFLTEEIICRYACRVEVCGGFICKCCSRRASINSMNDVYVDT